MNYSIQRKKEMEDQSMDADGWKHSPIEKCTQIGGSNSGQTLRLIKVRQIIFSEIQNINDTFIDK